MNDKKRLVKVETCGIEYLRVVGAVRVTPLALDLLLQEDDEHVFYSDRLRVTIYLSGSGELEVDVEELGEGDA